MFRTTAMLALLVVTAGTVPAEEPVDADDPAFEAFCPADLIGAAWTDVDPALMTDVALLLKHGEDVLGRPRKGISSAVAFRLAARMATRRQDAESLKRLAQAARRDGDDELQKLADSSLELASASRDTTFRMLVPVDEVDPDELERLGGVTRSVLRLGVIGDRDALDAFEKRLPELGRFDPQRKRQLKQLVERTRSTLPARPVLDEDARRVLRILAAPSRPDEEENADAPSNVSGAF